jgi:hypothetical protein
MIIGFAVTIIGLARSKNAAELTAAAVADVRHKLSLQNVLVDLTALMSDVEEIKVLHRAGAWDAMPTRYASIRKRLFSIKGNTPSLSKARRASLQGAIEQFKTIEQIVEIALASKETPKDVAALNKLAADQSDRLTIVLVAVQQSIGA